MACISKRLLHAYLDSELDDRIIRRIGKHLVRCTACKDLLEMARKSAGITSGMLSGYKNSFNDMDFKIPESIESAGDRHIIKSRAYTGMTAFVAKYRKLAAVAAVCCTVTVCFSVQPVRAFISDALKVFRVQSVKSFTLSLEDIEQIKRTLEFEGNIDFTFESLGSFSQSGFENVKADIDNVSEIAGFRLLAPHDPAGYETRISATEPGRLEFTLFTDDINSVLKKLGATKLLPDSADGKKIVAEFGSVVNMVYSGVCVFMVEQSIAPTVTMPSDVDEDELYECLVQLPIWPDNIKSRLASIKDWKSTIYIPVVGSSANETVIRGCSGIAWENTDKTHSCAAWLENGVVIAVNGSCPLVQIMEFISGFEVIAD